MGGHLMALLGVFQKLIASKAHDHEGFNILNAIIDNLPMAAYETPLPTVFQLLFERLQKSRTQKFVRGLLMFLAYFIVKQGPQLVSASMDKVQPGIFLMLMQQVRHPYSGNNHAEVWVPSMSTIDGSDEEKVVLVASTKCLCEYPALQQAPELWSQLKDATIKRRANTYATGIYGMHARNLPTAA
eukprot:365171-Chlamydomonas_euryale.AAC.12